MLRVPDYCLTDNKFNRINFRRCINWPTTIELIVEPHVYLHSAELVIQVGANGQAVSCAFKDDRAAIWRHVERPFGNAASAELILSWFAVANASPSAKYGVTVTARDAQGYPLDSDEISMTAPWLWREIGPTPNPTDEGRLIMIIHSD